MKKIKFINSKESCLVSDCDFNLLKAFRWYKNSLGYAARSINKNQPANLVLMHRLIMNNPKDMTIDHINGNKLDNRRENLRICTQAENIRHRVSLNRNNTSGIIGVSWFKERKKWRARIFVNGKEIHLGLFKDKLEAIKKRDIASEKYFGDFKSLSNSF